MTGRQILANSRQRCLADNLRRHLSVMNSVESVFNPDVTFSKKSNAGYGSPYFMLS